MQDNLVIVESPAKAKTIEKILGDNFLVKSSYGHIRDLAKHGISIDLENGFEPQYEVSSDKQKVVSELAKLSRSAKTVWLASDEDREGEAIAWHLAQTLSLDPAKTKRIVFHEITPDAINRAVENPRHIYQDLVDAQQARRILDRLVGFELSPLLWRKVKPSLSAGRVQSVVVKLIVEREREIMSFTATSFYRVTAEFLTAEGKVVKAEIRDRFSSLHDAISFLESIKSSIYTVSSVDMTPLKRSPAAPFTTSTLQQEASRKLGFSVSQTMSVAQRLYEAGLITYMRTDSVNLSSLAIATAAKAIGELFGEKYHKARQFSTKSKGAQEAHEAIRPTYMDRREAGSTTQEKRLYELIWKRTVASQMSDAQLEKTTARIDIAGRREQFVATGEIVKFDGFLKLYIESHDDDSSSEQESLLPNLEVGQRLAPKIITATERFTQRPPRYSEASLVKQLEELGIGRPSTYAPTISTVITRGYVVKEDRDGVRRDYQVITLKSGVVSQVGKSEMTGAEKSKLFPTDIGMVVTDFLEQNFTSILDYNFTANVEKEFDEIAEGNLNWRQMLNDFYTPFHIGVEAAGENNEYTRTERLLGVDPVSGKNVWARVGRFGPMVQLGDTSENDEDEKPKFASLQKGQLVASITLTEAMSLFALPRLVGQYEEADVVIGVGRFGPYVRHVSKFTSLKKEDDPYTITLERAVELIEAKREQERNRLIASFEAEPELEVLNGRFGAYICYKGSNYKIPKTVDPKSLDLVKCMELVAQGDANGTATTPKKRSAAGKSKVAATPRKRAVKSPAATSAKRAVSSTTPKKTVAMSKKKMSDVSSTASAVTTKKAVTKKS